MSTIERNKANVVAFYKLMFNDCRPRVAIERYAGDVYIQRNPHMPTEQTASSPLSSAWRANGPASAWTSGA
jgi:predicted SnoaL-like aldol condensation-catalyzing enzyme